MLSGTPRRVQILDSLAIGDFVEVRGPIGHFHYTRPGHFINHKHEGEASRINMIAGGTGITPMYQVMKEILANPADTTQLRLLYANQTEGDILIRDELEGLEKANPDRCAPAPRSTCCAANGGTRRHWLCMLPLPAVAQRDALRGPAGIGASNTGGWWACFGMR